MNKIVKEIASMVEYGVNENKFDLNLSGLSQEQIEVINNFSKSLNRNAGGDLIHSRGNNYIYLSIWKWPNMMRKQLNLGFLK